MEEQIASVVGRRQEKGFESVAARSSAQLHEQQPRWIFTVLSQRGGFCGDEGQELAGGGDGQKRRDLIDALLQRPPNSLPCGGF